ncbi:MAG: exopolyphosphatase [Chitinophagaceae bacterium]|nr:exopolyphosphatase [Chitinophagaceae bacterium]
MRLAAIDIGSNAARLLINDITTYKDGSLDFTKVNLVRVPLRLGFDVFEMGLISDQKIQDILEMIRAFKHLMKVYKVEDYRACATSAMRDAGNSAFILERILAETGIRIEVISGSMEAQILYETHMAETLDTSNAYLYIDVGGGSTELTFYNKQQSVTRQSFNIGTIRILKDQVSEDNWDELKTFVKTQVRSALPIVAIGSGGNINKIFSLSKRKPGKPLSLESLKEYYKEMHPLSVEERMHRYGFREDRADVIVPALQVYISVMRWAGIQDVFVPQIGLADGIIRTMYQSRLKNSLMLR